LIKSSLTTLLYTIAAWQKSVNNKVRVTKGVGIDSQLLDETAVTEKVKLGVGW